MSTERQDCAQSSDAGRPEQPESQDRSGAQSAVTDMHAHATAHQTGAAQKRFPTDMQA